MKYRTAAAVREFIKGKGFLVINENGSRIILEDKIYTVKEGDYIVVGATVEVFRPPHFKKEFDVV